MTVVQTGAQIGTDTGAGEGSIRFEIQYGARRISCAVSGDALDAVSGLNEPSTSASRRRSFDRFRTLIHLAATMQIEARRPGCVDAISITSRDLERVPPQLGLPKFGTSARHTEAAKPFDGVGALSGQVVA